MDSQRNATLPDLILKKYAQFLGNKIPENQSEFVNDVVNYVFTGLSTFSFVFMTFPLVMKRCQGIVGTTLGVGLLFFAGLVTVVAELCLGSGFSVPHYIRNIYQLVLITGFGTLVNIYGSLVLFEIPADGEASLGFSTSRVSSIICTVTIPLVIMELIAAISALKYEYWKAAEWFSGFIQKGVQAGLYHFIICQKIPKLTRRLGASWYLKTISLFNFSMWTISVVDGNTEMQQYINKLLDGGFASVLSAVYAALIIDYRLLCCFLFAELAIKVDSWDHALQRGRIEENGDDEERIRDMPVIRRVTFSQYKGGGYMIGMIVVVSQVMSALQYVQGGTVVGPWVAVFGILADVLVAFQGVILVMMVGWIEPDETNHRQKSKAVEILVGLMGVFALPFWVLRFVLSILALSSDNIAQLETAHEYFQWISVKFFVRIISVGFQLFIFYRIGPLTENADRIRGKNIAYFFLPSLMLCQLSVFLNSVIDSYSSFLEIFVEHSKLNVVTSTVYEIGEPLHLGFTLHMCFHFLTITNNLNGPWGPVRNNHNNQGDEEELINSDGNETDEEEVEDGGGGGGGGGEPMFEPMVGCASGYGVDNDMISHSTDIHSGFSGFKAGNFDAGDMRNKDEDEDELQIEVHIN